MELSLKGILKDCLYLEEAAIGNAAPGRRGGDKRALSGILSYSPHAASLRGVRYFDDSLYKAWVLSSSCEHRTAKAIPPSRPRWLR